MLNKRFNFTKADIDNLPFPAKGKREYYRDEKEAGLVLDVRASGSKSFYLYKKINGKPERIFLGQYPDMKIPEARKACAITKGEIAHGKNPQEEKRKIKQEITLGEVFQEYMEKYSKPHKKSWEYDEREIPAYFGHWFKRKLSSITAHEIRELHNAIYNKSFQKNGAQRGGTYQANRALERIRALYNKAIEWGWEGVNPSIGIKKFKEKSRDRFIQPNELPLLFAALEIEENKTARDYIKMSLMTGARKSNVLAMRWDQVNWDQRLWRIPETKNGEPISIPLIPQALDLLEKRQFSAQSPWVFQSDQGKGHLADPKKTWDRVRQRATLELWRLKPEYADLIDNVEQELNEADNYGFTIKKLFKSVLKTAEAREIELPNGLMDVRLHDLRRTFGSYQAITGASLPIIGKTLGHKSAQSTEIYARLHDDPVRDSMEKAAAKMFGS